MCIKNSYKLVTGKVQMTLIWNGDNIIVHMGSTILYIISFTWMCDCVI